MERYMTTRFDIQIVEEQDLKLATRGRARLYPFAELAVNMGFKVNDKKTSQCAYAAMYHYMRNNPSKQFKMFRTVDNVWYFKRVK